MGDVQKQMQSLLDQLVDEGRERGVQLAVYSDGALVVDVSAGVADVTTGRQVDGETLFPVFSATKALAATLIHLLAQRGKLDYDMPIADIWPEFAAHGKAGITVRHALSHTAGLQCMPRGIGYAEIVDWNTMCTAIAQLHPDTPPGTQMTYHAVTYSWLVGEVARRVDGRSFPQLLQEEICRPLGITSMFVGIPDEVEPRVAVLDEIFPEDGGCVPPDDSQPQSIPGWLHPLHNMMNRPDARRACIPASSGIMNARALARHYAALLPGGVDGVELLPPERICAATQPQLPTNGLDENAQHFGLGYQLSEYTGKTGTRFMTFGHGGYGGSIGFADPQHKLAVGFTKNLFSPNNAREVVIQKLREALDI